MAYTNSSLVNYKKLSPNHSGARAHTIDRITPHCVVGQLSVESIASCFTSPARQASCNYGIGKDGRIGLIVEEKNRSWCSSSAANDNRAITIELASDLKAPYAMTSPVYNNFINLCVDICNRYKKTKLVWIADKNKALKYEPKSNEMLLTIHKWFSDTACPGEWLQSRLGGVAAEVTKRLTPAPAIKEKKAKEAAKSFKQAFACKYKTKTKVNIRNGAGTVKTIIGTAPKGTIVECSGYYTATKNVNWLYAVCTVNNVKYTGYISDAKLSKVTTTTATAAVSKYFKKYTGTSGSIVDSLKAIKVDSSFAYRAKIAKANGIKTYVSSASQNIKLLGLLKQGKLIKP